MSCVCEGGGLSWWGRRGGGRAGGVSPCLQYCKSRTSKNRKQVWVDNFYFLDRVYIYPSCQAGYTILGMLLFQYKTPKPQKSNFLSSLLLGCHCIVLINISCLPWVADPHILDSPSSQVSVVAHHLLWKLAFLLLVLVL